MVCRIITGPVRSGKTENLFRTMKKMENNLFITNDPSVLYIELKMASNGMSGKCAGINSVAKTICQDAGIYCVEAANDIQKLVLSKVLMELKGLEVFKRNSYKGDNADKILSFIIECKENNVSPENLKNSVDDMAAESIKKMRDLSIVYDKFNQKMEELGLMSKEDILVKAISLLESGVVSYDNVCVDSLERYNPNTIRLIAALERCSNDFGIALVQIKIKNGQPMANDNIAIMDELYKTDKFVDRIETKRKKEELPRAFFAAETIEDEIEYAVSKAKELVQNGAKYDDIVISTTNPSVYVMPLCESLKNARLPYYYFGNRKLGGTSLFMMIDAMLGVLSDGEVSVDNAISILHSGFFDFSQVAVETTELFFERFGKDIKTAYKNGQEYAPVEKEIAQKVMERIANIVLEDQYENCGTSGEIIQLIVGILDKNKVFDVIKKAADSLQGEELGQAWNIMASLFDCIQSIYGEENIGYSNFKDILSKTASEKMIIQQTVWHNKITILDLDNSQNQRAPYIFILGCNDGLMPAPLAPQIIGDKDRNILNSLLGTDLKGQDDYTEHKRNAIYKSLDMADSRMYISWTKRNKSLEEMSPAGIVVGMLEESSLSQDLDLQNFNTDRQFLRLLGMLSELKDGKEKNESFDSMFDYFSKNPDYSKRLKTAVERCKMEELSFGAQIEDKGVYSATGLETYNQCPFRYLASKILRPKENKKFEETGIDMGNGYHEILKDFFERWKSNPNMDAETVLKETVDKVFEKHNENFLDANERNEYLKDKMKDKITSSARVALEQIMKGSFRPELMEYETGRDTFFSIDTPNGTAVITGKIDRIDVADDKKTARIIDYKSGDVGFSEDKLDLGIQLQLPLYSKAVENEFDVTGMYYFHIQSPTRDIDDETSTTREYRMSGPTLNNDEILGKNDRGLLEDGYSSDVIAAERTKKGEISARSQVKTLEEMKQLKEKAVEKAKETIVKIQENGFSAVPLKRKNYNACEYCQYRSLCFSN